MNDDVDSYESWICELCSEPVEDDDPQVTIAANAVMVEGDQFHELGGGNEMVFAMFHSQCVVDTVDIEDCDDVAYIWEARSFLKHSMLCDECRGAFPADDPDPEPKKKRPSYLTVIKGGE